MAVLTKHILGTPSGAVGDSVCFTTWKGKACIRSLASSYNDANTIDQQTQRAKFALLGATLTPLSDIINIGWKAFEQTGRKARTALNAYMKYHLKQVDPAELFVGTAPEYTSLNADQLLLSRGSLQGCQGISTAGAAGYKLTYNDDQDPTDLAYLVVYNYTKQNAVTSSCTVEESSLDITIPDSWSGDDLYGYVITTNASGNKASNSYNFKWEF